MNVKINDLYQVPLKYKNFEIVERKGLGHPDTICDSLMDSMSVAISKEYKKNFGTILHHNLDKCLLTAGRSEPTFGGGKITAPMKIFMGDRATMQAGDTCIDIPYIMEDNGNRWILRNLRYVNPVNVEFYSEVQPGSQNLADIFKRKNEKYLGANDTSATVGYYPFTPAEILVRELEKHLNTPEFHDKYPEAGEDVKVMLYRIDDKIDLTVSMAMVDSFIKDEKYYFESKKQITENIKEFYQRMSDNLKFKAVPTIHLNALDVKGRGTNGLYLTVSGTSAEAGDSGQVGRGNDVAGIIPLCRPMASEAAPGKNPVSHVGKIYNALCFRISKRVYEEIDNADEVYTWLVSRIGTPINEPSLAALNVTTASDKYDKRRAQEIVEEEFEHLDSFCGELAEGKIKLF